MSKKKKNRAKLLFPTADAHLYSAGYAPDYGEVPAGLPPQ